MKHTVLRNFMLIVFWFNFSIYFSRDNNQSSDSADGGRFLKFSMPYELVGLYAEIKTKAHINVKIQKSPAFGFLLLQHFS